MASRLTPTQRERLLELFGAIEGAIGDAREYAGAILDEWTEEQSDEEDEGIAAALQEKIGEIEQVIDDLDNLDSGIPNIADL